MVVWGGLTNSWEIREVKGRGERERYTELNPEFQERERRGKKSFLSEQCKEIEENSRMVKTGELFKKSRDIKELFHADRHNKGKKWQ